MSSVTPPPPPPTRGSNSPIPLPTVSISDPPTALLKLSIGAKIDGQLLGTDNRGSILAETSLGRIAFQTRLDFPSTGKIQFKVQSLGSQVLLLITAIHGKSPALLLRGSNNVLGPVLTDQKSPELNSRNLHSDNISSSNPVLPKGDSVNTSPSQPGLTTAKPFAFTEGSQHLATILKPTTTFFHKQLTNFPNTLTQFTTADFNKVTLKKITGASNIIKASKQMVKGHADKLGASGKASAGPGTSLIIKVLSVQPGSSARQTSEIPLPIQIGTTLEGIVSNAGLSSQTIIKTQAGPIALNVATELPIHTKIKLQIMQLLSAEHSSQSKFVSNRLGQIIIASSQWPALKETIELLAETNPVTSQQLINGVLPRLDATFLANFLSFLLLLRTGNIRHWLGDAPIRALAQLKPSLLRRLRDDFAGLRHIAEDRSSSEGRLFSIPLFNGSQIEQIRLWLCRKYELDEEDKGNSSKSGIHFVIEVNLSRLGRIQLDGFVEDSTKRFNLIIRTTNRLNKPIQQGIREVFENANKTFGITSGLAFQSSPANFIDLKNKSDETRRGLMV